MTQIRKEIYDDNGLVEVVFIDVKEQNEQDLLEQKEAELIAIYKEIELLKNK